MPGGHGEAFLGGGLVERGQNGEGMGEESAHAQVGWIRQRPLLQILSPLLGLQAQHGVSLVQQTAGADARSPTKLAGALFQVRG